MAPMSRDYEEAKIQVLHTWIERLCDPQQNLCKPLNSTLAQVSFTILITHIGYKATTGFQQFLQRLDGSKSVVDADANVRRRVGSISLKGITSLEELEILEEESDEQVAEPGSSLLFVTIISAGL